MGATGRVTAQRVKWLIRGRRRQPYNTPLRRTPVTFFIRAAYAVSFFSFPPVAFFCYSLFLSLFFRFLIYTYARYTYIPFGGVDGRDHTHAYVYLSKKIADCTSIRYYIISRSAKQPPARGTCATRARRFLFHSTWKRFFPLARERRLRESPEASGMPKKETRALFTRY